MSKKTVGSLLVRLGMDAKDADQAIKKMERQLKDVGRRMEATGRAMSIGFTAPFLAMVAKGIQAFDEEAQATRRLQVALGGTSKALLDQAAALQKTTTYADDAIITEQAWAAALGHSESQILSMTTAAASLAAGIGTDLHSAMEMLHKTTTGTAGALGKLIPEVKNMTEAQLRSGEAVALVEEKFRGFAEAAAMTGAGPIKVLTNSFGDLMEQIGEAALPLVIAITEKVKVLITWFQNLSPEVKQAAIAFGAIGAAIGPILLLLPQLVKWFALLTGPIGLTVMAIAGLGAVAIYVAYNWELFKDRTLTIWDNIREGIVDSVNAIIAAINVVSRTSIKPLSNPKKLGSGVANPDYKSFGEVMTEVGGDVFKFIGGDKGLDAIRKAEELMKNLGKATDNTGESFRAAGVKAQTMVSALPGLGGRPMATSLSSNGQGGSREDPLAGMSEIGYDMTGSINAQNEALSNYANTWSMIGDAVSGGISRMGSALKEGEGFFASFTKAAITASLQIIKAKLAETAVANFSWWVTKFGPAGIALGAVSIAAGNAVIDGIINSIQAPALAQGGMAYGPTMAMVGDNPNAHVDPEVISPLSKLKGMMGGGSRGGGVFEFRLHNRELTAALTQADYDDARMMNPRVIKF
jgi:phage-related protein